LKQKLKKSGVSIENKILFALAMSKEPLSKYQLPTIVRMAYSNIFDATKELFNDGWIQIGKIEP